MGNGIRSVYVLSFELFLQIKAITQVHQLKTGKWEREKRKTRMPYNAPGRAAFQDSALKEKKESKAVTLRRSGIRRIQARGTH